MTCRVFITNDHGSSGRLRVRCRAGLVDLGPDDRLETFCGAGETISVEEISDDELHEIDAGVDDEHCTPDDLEDM